MKTFDAAIIGGGIIGISCALALTEAGLQVAVFDRREPGREASWAAAGMLSPAPHLPGDEPLVALARASLRLYPQFISSIEAASQKRANYVHEGAMELFFGADAPQERDRYVVLCRRLGLEVEAISATEARRRESVIASTTRAAAYFSDEAVVEPRALMEAAIDAARALGVEIYGNAPVQSITIQQGRCCAVIAGNERIAVSHVVVAAGCFSREIFTPDSHGGQRIAPFLPTRPVRGQMIALLPRDTRLARAVRSSRGYLVPRGNGWIVAGSTLEDAGFDKHTTTEGLQQIRKTAIELVPDLADAEIVESWCGLRPGTPDDLPILGPVDLEGVIVATGHFRNGILLAPITAQLVKAWITQTELPVAADRYSPFRFLPSTVQAVS
ncbi:MAG TPA: glycine oxidase ThiO [Candidatus Acidoferrales bacterium]|nr:glycine oxidase ThiO [Candidatus Acidoferrales bacterium]